MGEELEDSSHFGMCAAAAGEWSEARVKCAARHASVLRQPTETEPHLTSARWAPDLPDISTPTFVTVVHLENGDRLGVSIQKAISKQFKVVTTSAMKKHWVLWGGPAGRPINLCGLWQPGSQRRARDKASAARDQRGCDVQQEWTSDACIWAATCGAWLEAHGGLAIDVDTTVNVATSNHAVLVVSWDGHTHHQLVQRLFHEYKRHGWTSLSKPRLHATQPLLPTVVQEALRFLAGCGTSSATLFGILRMLECFTADVSTRSVAVESLLFDHDGSIIRWLAFRGFGCPTTSTTDSDEEDSLYLSAALFPARVHRQLVLTWRQVRHHGPALTYLDFLCDVETMSRYVAGLYMRAGEFAGSSVLDHLHDTPLALVARRRYKPLRAFGVPGGEQWIPFDTHAQPCSEPRKLVFTRGGTSHDVHAVDGERNSPLTNGDDFEWLYHGTTAQSAQHLMAHGVSAPQHCDPPREKLDFGPGFYLTPSFDLARDWARRAFSGKKFDGTPADHAEPAVVAFKFTDVHKWPHEPNHKLLADGLVRKMTQHRIPITVADAQCSDEDMEWKTAIRCGGL